MSPHSLGSGMWTKISPAIQVSADILEGRFNFKDSPFYTIIEQITPAVECRGVFSTGKSNLRPSVILIPQSSRTNKRQCGASSCS